MKSGYVAIIGRPNVGKSTLLNAIVGEPLSIVTLKNGSPKKGVKVLTRISHQFP